MFRVVKMIIIFPEDLKWPKKVVFNYKNNITYNLG